MADEPNPTAPEPTPSPYVTPDSDDLRPFPEVCEEGVDEMMRELIRAARESYRAATPKPDDAE